MFDFITIATRKEALESALDLAIQGDYKPVYLSRQGEQLPIILIGKDGYKTELATYGLKRNELKIPIKRVLYKRPYNKLIRTNRCAIPVNCFFGKYANHPYLIRVLNERLICLAGLYEVTDNGEHRFAILTTEPADTIRHLADHAPVLFKIDGFKRWLKTTNMQDVMEFADKSSHHWFDYFQVSDEVINADRNSKELLVPVGLSRQQVLDREDQLKGLELDKIRTDKGSSKY